MDSDLEKMFAFQLRALKLHGAVKEYRFAAHEVGLGPGIKVRLSAARLHDWRFDFAWPSKRFAVEIEGGGWTDGRHTRGKGFTQDMQKYHHAMRLGWTIYRCDGALIQSGDAVALVEQLLKKGVSHV